MGTGSGSAPRRALGAVVALFLLAMAWVAVWVPFHATDSLIYGRWSRLIGLEGGLDFDDQGIVSGYLHRPLVYVVQGELWRVFGFHEWIGRVWFYVFLLVLFWVVFRVASADRGTGLTGAIACVLLIASPDVVAGGASGLTDIPVAAMCGLVGLVVLVPGRRAPIGTALVIAVASALAVLAKPSAPFALLGVGLALFIGARETLVWRLLWRGVPIAAGAAIALIYDALQANHLGLSLSEFLSGANGEPLSAGVTSYYQQLNAQSRSGFILAMEWLGPYLVLPLIFALLYAALRVAGRRHRLSVTIAVPVALVLSYLLPALASAHTSGAVGPWDAHRPIAVIGTLALIVPLWLARDCPEEDVPTREHLARMLLWALPPTLVWIVNSPFQTRYLSPAWVPLYAITAVTLWTAMRGLAQRRAALSWVLVGIIAVLGVVNLRNLDGLGSRPDGSISAVNAVRDLGLTGWFHEAEARRASDPSLGALHDDTAAALRDGGRLISVDGRLPFYWPLRTTRSAPQTCAALHGYRVLVVTESATGLDTAREKQLTAAELAEATGGRAAQPSFWKGCPGVTLQAEVPGQFAVFRIGST
jgi:4-amino-4-deoxy-L-arabinose transferase-like glycosyltransferase